MPSIATGVRVANRELLLIGVSGDGDTASIGLGQFCHLVRRNVPVVYIVENNGVYGLTKGQFSAPPTWAARRKEAGPTRSCRSTCAPSRSSSAAASSRGRSS